VRTVKRIAVVGSGISGLGVAWSLARGADPVRLTLFEAGHRFGGHAHTVDVTLQGVTHGVDTGFLVFNERTYPNLVLLFTELGVQTATSDMSFSVQARQAGLEWSGRNLDTVFAQRSNLLRPRFWSMLADILRFNRQATGLAVSGAENQLQEPIVDFLRRHRYGNAFRDGYFLPMVGSIWSCPTDQMLQFPISTLIRFCHNHGLIQVTGRPQWRTVKGGARNYVQKMLKGIPDARLNTPVLGIKRLRSDTGAGGVLVATAQGTERFDEVVLACHSDQALRLLDDVTADERRVLGAIAYRRNCALLHTDSAVLPARRKAWAAWNYARADSPGREQAAVCLHYLINQLQPLPWQQPVVVSLNPDPARLPAANHVIAEMSYEHPVFDPAAVAAQARLPMIQGHSHLWFCGAWTRYGFHEDGLTSALKVVDGLRAQWRSPAQRQVAA